MSSELKINTISEVTSANGVSIDGLKVKDSALVTDTNKYPYVKSGELNSIGYLNQNFFGASYYLSNGHDIASSTFSEIGDASSGTGRWTKMLTSGSSGSDDADPFGKFNGTTGRWTPTVSGYYLVCFNVKMNNIDDGEYIMAQARIDGGTTAGGFINGSQVYSSATNQNVIASGSGILGLDTDSYISLWGYHNEDSTVEIRTIDTTMSFLFVGTSDL